MPEFLVNQEYGSAASIIGLIISILSFFFSLWAIKGVKEIRRRFLAKARIPQLMKDLTEKKGEICRLLDDYDDNKSAIITMFATIEPLLCSLKKIVDRDERRQLRKVRGSLSVYRGISWNNISVSCMLRPRSQRTYESALGVYTELNVLIETVKQKQKDRKWEVS